MKRRDWLVVAGILALIVAIYGIGRLARSGDEREQVPDGRSLIVFTDDEPVLIINSSASAYYDAKVILESDASADYDGYTHTVSASTYAELVALVPPLPIDDDEELREWQEEMDRREEAAERVWRAEELVECDTVNLNRQLDGEDTGEPLSDCEVAVFAAQLETLSEVDKLPLARQTEFFDHIENLEAISQKAEEIYADKVIDSEEYSLSCFVFPQWDDHVHAAKRWLVTQNNEALLGFETDIVRTEQFIDRMREACS